MNGIIGLVTPLDESEKLVAGLGGLLHGEQSSHQPAAQLTAGLGGATRGRT